jgi:Ubiquitin elongating factor core
MIQSDLFKSDSIQTLCSTRPFLLGITISLLELCITNLSSRLAEMDVDAFEYQYLQRETIQEENDNNDDEINTAGLVVVTRTERPLIGSWNRNETMMKLPKTNTVPTRYSGATEFFFLTAAMLRISLSQGFRVDDEFRYNFRHILDSLTQATSHLEEEQRKHQNLSIESVVQQMIPKDLMDQYQKYTSITQGWLCFIDDRDVSTLITSFSLLQLEWVAKIAVIATDTTAKMVNNINSLSHIPEWFVKLPSQWLSRK